MSLAEIFGHVAGDRPVRFVGYDGSRSGPEDAPATVELKSPLALRYLASARGELGVARAYVTGHLDITGDLYEALRALLGGERPGIGWAERAEVLRTLGIGVLSPMPRPPEEAPPPRQRGRRHSKARDAAAISHHYDVSNAFYSMILGPSMAYTCAVFEKPSDTLEQAQAEKFDLVCRKLGLRPGMRLLDVGCGWGGMVMHAVEHYGVRAFGVTLSKQQADWASQAIDERGLTERAEVRFLDYREVTETGFDAVSSIGLTEHIGEANLASYFTFLADKLTPGGRMLNHCITRPNGLEGSRTGSFIDRYVFPDGELVGPGTIVSQMHDHGLEVRHLENLREHYAMTLAAWGVNLERNWSDIVAEAGLGRARVWRLYLAASRVNFELDRIELHQVLGVRTGPEGQSGVALRPSW